MLNAMIYFYSCIQVQTNPLNGSPVLSPEITLWVSLKDDHIRYHLSSISFILSLMRNLIFFFTTYFPKKDNFLNHKVFLEVVNKWIRMVKSVVSCYFMHHHLNKSPTYREVGAKIHDKSSLVHFIH